MRKLIFAVLSTATFAVKAQVVTLFAGSPYQGNGAFSGATGAINKFSDSFSIPWCIAPDTSGRFWITDQHNLSIIIGNNNYLKGGTALNPNLPGSADYQDATGTNARFANPAGCFVHPKTNRVFICDADNNVIRYMTSSVVNATDAAIWDTYAGVQSFLGSFKDGSTSVAEFASPQDLVITSGGVVYVADRDNHCIRKISGGNVSTIAGLGTADGDVDGTGSVARFYAPTGLFLVDDTTLLVADRNNGKIKKVNLNTAKVTTVVSGLNFPTDVVQVNGIIYISDSYSIRSWNGTSLSTYAGKMNTPDYVNASDISARFNDITLISYHPKTESIYLADMGNNVFRKLTVIQPPVADFVATKTAVTVNEVIKITSTSKYGKTYLWNISPASYTLENGSKLTDTIIFVSFQIVDVYTVELTATNPTGSHKATKNAYINVTNNGSNKPTTDFSADITLPTMGQTVSFIDETYDNPTTWAWTFTPNTVTYQNGTSASSRFPKVTFDANGKYTVELTTSNTNGSSTKTKPDYITVGPAAVDNYVVLELNVFPNPAADKLFVGYKCGNVSVTNVSGQSQNVVVTSGVIDVGNLAEGVYFINGIGAEGKKYTGRFVKINN